MIQQINNTINFYLRGVIMGAELKAELNIPDLWFDFYARFLPGTTFVIIVRFFLLGYKNIPAFEAKF